MAKKTPVELPEDKILPKDFVASIVEGGTPLENMCATCQGIVVCKLAENAYDIYQNTGVAQIVKICPYYVTRDEMQVLHQLRAEKTRADEQSK